jgi:hypothetical protein
MNLAVGLGLRWIPVLIAVTMLGGGVVNIAAPTAIRNSYREWGFPARFYYVTGVLELLAAGLIFFVPAGIFGMLLAAVVLVAAVGTLVRHREAFHAVPAVVMVALIGIWFWL